MAVAVLPCCQGAAGAGEGFEVTKFGHGRVALIGFPSAGLPLKDKLEARKLKFLASSLREPDPQTPNPLLV
eukprot:SM006142S19833  [mRNA]  locus=s6142:315:619:+ [translate_table: standard]